MTLTLLFSLAAYCLSLLLGRHFVRNEETLFFPMGGASHSFLLRCRRWQKQDHLTFRIKELTAFGIAKSIWSVF